MSREDMQFVTIARRAVAATEKVLEYLEKDMKQEVRDGCVAILSVIELLKSLYPISEHGDVLNTCSEALNAVMSLILKNNASTYDPVQLSTISSSLVSELTPLTFASIIGSTDAKQSLYENVVLPLSISESARKQIFRGIRSGGGNVLLFGPPGTGKTQMAQAAAFESNSKLFYIRPSEILSKYQGESERHLSKLFEDARATDKAVIFFDEFDSIATARGMSDDTGNNRRLLAELLLQLTLHRQLQSPPSLVASKTERVGKVVIIAATNRLQDLDEAILRRFDAKVYVGTPSPEERADMVSFFLSDIEHRVDNLQREAISADTEGWSGSEIQSLCREAAMIPIREALPYTTTCIPPSAVPNSLKRNIGAVFSPGEIEYVSSSGNASTTTSLSKMHHQELSNRTQKTRISPTQPSNSCCSIRAVTKDDFDSAHETLMKPHMLQISSLMRGDDESDILTAF